MVWIVPGETGCLKTISQTKVLFSPVKFDPAILS